MKAALLLIGAFLFCGGTLCGQSIPITRAISLADTTVTLPGDLKGRPAILVLGFSKNSSQQTKPWTEAIERDFGSQEKIAFYQFPMLQEVPRLVRSFVLQGMRKPLNTAQRSHFCQSSITERLGNRRFISLVPTMLMCFWSMDRGVFSGKQAGLSRKNSTTACASEQRQ